MRTIKKAFAGLLGMICTLSVFSQQTTIIFKNNPFFQRYPLELYRESAYNLMGVTAIFPDDSLRFTFNNIRPEGEYFRLWTTHALILYVKPGSHLVVDYASRNSYRTKFEGDVAEENVWLNQKMFLSYDLLYPERLTGEVSYDTFRRQVRYTADSLGQSLSRLPFSDTFLADSRVRLEFIACRTLLNYLKAVPPGQTQQAEKSGKRAKEIRQQILKEVDKILSAWREKEVLRYTQVTQLLENICDGIDHHCALRAGYTLFDELYRWKQLKNDVFQLYGSGTEQFLKTAGDSVVRTEVARFVETNRTLLTGADAMDFEFQDIAGHTHRLSDYKGMPLYIDVWATWCNPCIALAPAFHQLAGEYEGKKIRFISVSIDKQRSVWLNYLKKQHKIPYVLELHTGNKQFTAYYKIAGIPRFILIDKDFKIRMAFGYKPLEVSMPELKALLDRMIEE